MFKNKVSLEPRMYTTDLPKTKIYGLENITGFIFSL